MKRERLAKLLEAGFSELGVVARVDPSDLHPATGCYRSDCRRDVYRWEGWGRREAKGHESVVSWYTMTALLRGGGVKLIWDRDIGAFEAVPK